jgi:hypothetical protein
MMRDKQTAMTAQSYVSDQPVCLLLLLLLLWLLLMFCPAVLPDDV